ncbi:MAG: hypothetical protein F4X20_03585 [Dehalococcoidia bacterium]|nr:hypothetical protein [Dehalococcoidia bacterium]
MPDFIDLLEQFNRKERFFLFLRATGEDELRLSAAFREQLSQEIGIPVPETAYAATDYHLDWLAASVVAYQHEQAGKQFLGNIFPNHGEQKIVTGSQEDIDLLVAFPAQDGFHIVLVEAKGYERWSISQLNSKAERLKRIFPNPGKDGITPHFCLASNATSRPPRGNKVTLWPEWMRKHTEPYWIELDLPRMRRSVTRTDKLGNRTKRGRMFKIVTLEDNKVRRTQDRRFEKGTPNRLTRTGQKDRRYRVNRKSNL